MQSVTSEKDLITRHRRQNHRFCGIYTEGVGDGHSGGVLHLGAGCQKDIKPGLLQVLYQVSGSKMLLMVLMHAGGTSPPCEKLEHCALHLHEETNSLVFLGAGNPVLGTTVPS